MGSTLNMAVGEIYESNHHGPMKVTSLINSRKIEVMFLQSGFVTQTSARNIRDGSVGDYSGYQPGAVYKTRKSGLAEIVCIQSGQIVLVKFLNTGAQKLVSMSNLKKGTVVDDLMKTVCGVGFLGSGEYRPFKDGARTPAYQCWRDMLKRCYDEKSLIRAPTYAGCSVCDEWHDFQNFAKWFDNHYPDDGQKYDIDKDIRVPGNKVYSPMTCSFVSRAENNKEMANRNFAKSYRLLNPDDAIVSVRNLREHCRNNQLDQGAMRRVAIGKQSHHKGWRLFVSDNPLGGQ